MTRTPGRPGKGLTDSFFQIGGYRRPAEGVVEFT
jgi:hypothetical protein